MNTVYAGSWAAPGWSGRSAVPGAIVLAVALLACAAPAAQSGAGDAAASTRPGSGTAPAAGGAEELLYVCNQNDATVSIIDQATLQVIRTVDLQRLGFSENARPHHIAVEPDGSYWYVTLIGENRIVKLDRSDRVVAQAEFQTPGMLSLHPGDDLLFVGRSMTAVNPPQRVGVVRRSDMRIDEIDVFFPRPHALALDTRTGTVYTASLAVNQIAALDIATERVTLQDVAGPPHALMQFAIAPDGHSLALSGELTHKVFILDVADRLRPRLQAEIDVGQQPFDPIYTPDGRWLYVPNKAANTVTVIDAQTHRIAEVIRGDGLAQPHGVAVSADGRHVYVSNNNLRQVHDMAGHEVHAPQPATPAGRGTIVVIDVTTHRIVRVIEVGHNASGIATRTRQP